MEKTLDLNNDGKVDDEVLQYVLDYVIPNLDFSKIEEDVERDMTEDEKRGATVEAVDNSVEAVDNSVEAVDNSVDDVDNSVDDVDNSVDDEIVDDEIVDDEIVDDEIVDDEIVDEPKSLEEMNSKERQELMRKIEKGLNPFKIKKPTQKETLEDIEKNGSTDQNIKEKWKLFNKAKKPTKYEKEQAKKAGIYKSKKEEEEINKILDDFEKKQNEAAKKLENKERVEKFFKPLQYERKIWSNGRNRVLPKGTFVSADGTEYYNPETETIEQISEEEKEQEEIEKKQKSNVNNRVLNSVEDAFTNKVGYNIWDSIIKGI